MIAGDIGLNGQKNSANRKAFEEVHIRSETSSSSHETISRSLRFMA